MIRGKCSKCGESISFFYKPLVPRSEWRHSICPRDRESVEQMNMTFEFCSCATRYGTKDMGHLSSCKFFGDGYDQS